MRSSHMIFYFIVAICLARIPPIQSHFTSARSVLNEYMDMDLQNDNNRDLQAFSTLNNIISEITLVLPDADVSSNGLDITITDLLCYEANIQDVQVTRSSSDTIDHVGIDAIGLTVTCNFHWSYEWSILSVVNGSGTGKAVLDRASSASVELDIKSGYPPRDVSVESCVADVQIDDLILDGDGLGSIASIINLFKRLVIGLIEQEVNGAVCYAVEELGNEDGALVFVVESNEHVVTYETQSVNASTSGAGWLALFITVVIVYSISCCVFGAFFVRKISSCDRLKGTRCKTVEGKCVNDTEENAAQAMTSDGSERF